MKVIQAPLKITGLLKKLKLKNKTIGFIPTMGALHQGHLSLIRQARKENDFVVVSIFVNPAQFGPREDFKRYPKDIKKDIALCRRQGIDLIFIPKVNRMYPKMFSTHVTVEGLSNVLCGKSRPSHFRGVTTVVAKLFNIILPDIAYFGQKDIQQAIIIKRMARDLNIPVVIKVMPTVREKDGLALSSRNIYLSQKERKDALVLFGSLKLAKGLIKNGIRDADKIIRTMRKLIKKKNNAKIDYVAIVDCENLSPIKKTIKGCIIALAVWIGKARLIDNMIV